MRECMLELARHITREGKFLATSLWTREPIGSSPFLTYSTLAILPILRTDIQELECQ